MRVRELLPATLLNHHRPTGRPGAWYGIRNAAADRVVVELYDVIGDWGVSAAEFVRDLRDITAPTIELHINSPGGLFYDGLTIFNGLRDHPARVEAIVDGLAASAASFILQAAEHRTMNRHSQLMIHDALMLTLGNEVDHLESATQLARVSDNIAAIYAGRAGGAVADWRAAMRAETWYSAVSAAEVGLADEAIADDIDTDDSDVDDVAGVAPRTQLATLRARAYLKEVA